MRPKGVSANLRLAWNSEGVMAHLARDEWTASYASAPVFPKVQFIDFRWIHNSVPSRRRGRPSRGKASAGSARQPALVADRYQPIAYDGMRRLTAPRGSAPARRQR